MSLKERRSLIERLTDFMTRLSRKFQFDRYIPGQLVACRIVEIGEGRRRETNWHRAFVTREAVFDISGTVQNAEVHVQLLDSGRTAAVKFVDVAALPVFFLKTPAMVSSSLIPDPCRYTSSLYRSIFSGLQVSAS